MIVLRDLNQNVKKTLLIGYSKSPKGFAQLDFNFQEIQLNNQRVNSSIRIFWLNQLGFLSMILEQHFKNYLKGKYDEIPLITERLFSIEIPNYENYFYEKDDYENFNIIQFLTNSLMNTPINQIQVLEINLRPNQGLFSLIGKIYIRQTPQQQFTETIIFSLDNIQIVPNLKTLIDLFEGYKRVISEIRMFNTNNNTNNNFNSSYNQGNPYYVQNQNRQFVNTNNNNQFLQNTQQQNINNFVNPENPFLGG